MPFFGGTTLAHSLEQVAPIPPADRKPTDLWDIVATGPGTNILGTSLALPPRWAATDYTALIAHLAVCLADALQFAHDRGLVHMDVKPSNILLTADGQPMLLDFHLARPPVSANDPPPARLGGTPVYCAPEQWAALDAVRVGQHVPIAVDRRADVYALGVVLYEALAGRLPNPGVPVFHHNSRVSVGLSDIVTRCLAPNPANRYAEAAALAADLRYHLAALPLRGVRNRSFAERWRKWRRRRPHKLGIIAGLAMGLVAIGVAAAHIGHRRGMAQIALEEGSSELDRGRVAEARGAFRRGLAAAEGLPVGTDLEAALASGLRRADRAAAAADLHAVAEGMRALSVADTIPRGDRDAANRLGRQLWDRRDELFALAATDLPPTVRDRARADLFDVVLVWCQLRAEATPDERPAVLEVLAEVESRFGPCAGICLQRAAVARGLGRAAEADVDMRRAVEMPAQSSWDHVALGAHYLHRGELEPARAELERAVVLDPRSFWARLVLGRCELARGRQEDALLSFAICVGLEPENPVGHVHKGHAHARLGQRERALADVERALALDPNNSQARILRAAIIRAD